MSHKLQTEKAEGNSTRAVIVLAVTLFFFAMGITYVWQQKDPVTDANNTTSTSLSADTQSNEPLALKDISVDYSSPNPDNNTENNSLNISVSDLNVLVDKTHSIPSDYVPTNLVTLRSLSIVTETADISLRKDAAIALKSLMNEMNKQNLYLSGLSAYRSYDVQRITYQRWVNDLGVIKADKVSAKPGHSEHQLGTTIDLVLTNSSGDLNSIYPGKASPEWTWLDQNAHKFGFVMSYRHQHESLTGYKFEPWHWRYVGVDLATKIRYSTDTPQSHYLIIPQ